MLCFALKGFQKFLLERFYWSEPVGEWIDVTAPVFNPVIQMGASDFPRCTNVSDDLAAGDIHPSFDTFPVSSQVEVKGIVAVFVPDTDHAAVGAVASSIVHAAISCGPHRSAHGSSIVYTIVRPPHFPDWMKPAV